MIKKVDIILPVYREENNLERVIAGISRHVKTSHRIMAIWQDPSDPSIPILIKLKKKYSQLEIFQSKKGIGLLHAIMTGISNSKSDFVIIMMSDSSDNPKDVDKMIIKMSEGYSLVCASRYMQNGKRIGGSRSKALLSWLTCVTLHYVAGVPTLDSTNAFKCINKKLLNKIKIESKNGFELPLELVVKAHRLKYKIGEIPTIWRERGEGYSKFKIFELSPFYLTWYKYALQTRFNL